MSPFEILGILSATGLLVVFVLNQYRFLSSENIWYDLINFLAAIGLLIYALYLQAIPFVVTNAVWGIVSFIDVIKDLRKKKI